MVTAVLVNVLVAVLFTRVVAVGDVMLVVVVVVVVVLASRGGSGVGGALRATTAIGTGCGICRRRRHTADVGGARGPAIRRIGGASGP